MMTFKPDWSRIVNRMGHYVANEWRLRVSKQLDIDMRRFPPNKPSTLARKSSRKRLIDTGALVKSGLKVRMMGSTKVMVYFQDAKHPGKKSKKGKLPKNRPSYRDVARFNLAGHPGANRRNNPVKHFGVSRTINEGIMRQFKKEIWRETKRATSIKIKVDFSL